MFSVQDRAELREYCMDTCTRKACRFHLFYTFFQHDDGIIVSEGVRRGANFGLMTFFGNYIYFWF